MLKIGSHKYIIVTIILFFNFNVFYSQKYNDKYVNNSEIECVAVGLKNTKLIKVWVLVKNPDKAVAQAKLNAIHGMIFKGAAGKCIIKPISLETNNEIEKKKFFDNFFRKNGDYLRFINTSSVKINPNDRIKILGNYKIGVQLSVNYTSLQNYLMSNKVVKSYNDFFKKN
jgi:hypothetical protein